MRSSWIRITGGGRSLSKSRGGEFIFIRNQTKILGGNENFYKCQREPPTALHFDAGARGRDISDRELGLITTQIRKDLATAFVRVQSLCLLIRLCSRNVSQEAGGWQKERKRGPFQAHIHGH